MSFFHVSVKASAGSWSHVDEYVPWSLVVHAFQWFILHMSLLWQSVNVCSHTAHYSYLYSFYWIIQYMFGVIWMQQPTNINIVSTDWHHATRISKSSKCDHLTATLFLWQIKKNTFVVYIFLLPCLVLLVLFDQLIHIFSFPSSSYVLLYFPHRVWSVCLEM